MTSTQVRIQPDVTGKDEMLAYCCSVFYVQSQTTEARRLGIN